MWELSVSALLLPASRRTDTGSTVPAALTGALGIPTRVVGAGALSLTLEVLCLSCLALYAPPHEFSILIQLVAFEEFKQRNITGS